MRHITSLTLFVLLVGGGLFGQAPTAPATTDASRVAEFIKDLGSADFETRTRATESLRALGEAARQSLETAQSDPNLERKTRAAQLLQELDELKRGVVRGGIEPVQPVAPGTPGLGGIVEIGPGQIESLIEQFRKAQGGIAPLPGQPVIPGELSPTERAQGAITFELQSGSSSRSVSVVRDHERIEASREANGHVAAKITQIDPKTAQPGTTETFEAADAETFKTSYPEVYEKLKGMGLFDEIAGVQTLVPGRVFSTSRLRQRTVVPGRDLAPPITTHPVLGVTLTDVPEALRAHVDLPQRAMMVESVSPGSTAETMGLRPFDLLTHAADVEIGSVEDLRNAVGNPQSAEILKIRVLRKAQVLELSGAWPKVR